MKQVYIIGSLSRGKDIKNIAEYIRLNGDFDVKYVKKDPRDLDVLIAECYDKIEAADVVIAVEETPYIFGTGTLYEIEYAKRCKKPILYTDGNNLSTLFMRLCLITINANTVEGLRQGFIQKEPALIAEVQRIANQIADSMHGALHINSPSKLSNRNTAFDSENPKLYF